MKRLNLLLLACTATLAGTAAPDAAPRACSDAEREVPSLANTSMHSMAFGENGMPQLVTN
ncbi:MAG: hypothetical protein IT480_17230 [Gammaproteobacteria bacterium]|nr:hypothetical protein [Gammaproteobacteria bacterium]